MYKPKCETPLLLVNRAALNYAKLGGAIHGDVKYQVYSPDVQSINHASLLEYAKNNMDKIEDCYVQLPNGYKEPLYCLVPCGHCVLCRDNKRNDLVFRATMESACYTCPPMFITLTYDNDHLPAVKVGNKRLVHGNLCYKDVQDFFKRLRRVWDRKGIKHNIRYLVAGEYGSKYGRAHYHIILWNNPYNTDENNPLLFNQLMHDVFKSWGKCQPSGFDFGQCRGGAAGYAAKYVSKPCNLHGHHIKPFIHCSNGHGGLGAPLLHKLKDYLRQNPHLREVSFKGYDGTLFEVQFSSYITSQIWPSPTRLIHPNLRNLYKQYCDTLAAAQSLQLLSYDEAKELSGLINPASDVLPNQVLPTKRHFMCSTAIDIYYKNKIFQLLSTIADELSERQLIDYEYLSQYFKYKLLTPAANSRDFASKILRIQSKNYEMQDKEIF